MQLHARQKNIDRYNGLLKTKLSETERQYLEKRVGEETTGMLKSMEQAISTRTPPARWARRIEERPKCADGRGRFSRLLCENEARWRRRRPGALR